MCYRAGKWLMQNPVYASLFLFSCRKMALRNPLCSLEIIICIILFIPHHNHDSPRFDNLIILIVCHHNCRGLNQWPASVSIVHAKKVLTIQERDLFTHNCRACIYGQCRLVLAIRWKCQLFRGRICLVIIVRSKSMVFVGYSSRRKWVSPKSPTGCEDEAWRP